MAVGSRDRPPMLATGRYAQWKSRFLRYIDTRPNGNALRKCILEAHEMWIAIERLQPSKSLNIQDVKTNLFWEFEKFTSHDGESMESYYSRFYKMINEMIRNNLTVARMQVNVQFLQQFQPEWSRKPKYVKDFTYHKEKMLMCKQSKKGVPLQVEQADWLEDTDEEIDEQELKAHYSFMAKIQEVPTADLGTDTEPLE
nr:hypothetical protein [Tanacetum cinerariifolium]